MGTGRKSAQRRPPRAQAPTDSAVALRERLGLVVRERRRALRRTLQEVADAVGCAKSYLWLIEHEGRANPASDDLLIKLEEALGLERGRLIRAARWQATPAVVKREVESRDAVTRRLAQILGSGKGALDRVYRSGELRKLVETLAPEQAPAPAAPRAVAGTIGTPGPGWREVPLINKVAAGYPREFTDLGYPARSADEYVRCPDLADPDAFAARVVGDSMLPDYREGDIVVFSPAKTVASGMDCFARIEPDHETTFKRAYFESGTAGESLIRLQPLNPAYTPRVLAREQVAGLYAAVSVTRKV